MMVFFNDPFPCDDAGGRAVRMAAGDPRRGARAGRAVAPARHDLALGIGIAQGYATLGRIGFEGRFDYAAIGSVTNLAARLCAEAGPWQILVTQRVLAATEDWRVVGAGRRLNPRDSAAGAGPQHHIDTERYDDDN